MKLWHYIAAGAGALLAWNLFSRHEAAKSLNFLLGHVEGINWEDGRPVIPVVLNVQNTSNHEFNLLSFAGTVFVDTADGEQYAIGDVSDFTQTKISPNSETDITIKLRLRLLGIVSDMINQIQTGSFSQVIEFTTYANVDQLQIPVNLKFKLA